MKEVVIESPSFVPLDGEDRRAKLFEIMFATLKDSWGIILKIDDPLNLKSSNVDFNSHWKHQSEMIQRFLTGSLGDGGFGNLTTEDFFETENVIIEVLTAELKFQSMLLSEAVDLLAEDVEYGRLYHVDDLQQYLRATHAAIGGRLDYLFNELKRRVPHDAIAA